MISLAVPQTDASARPIPWRGNVVLSLSVSVAAVGLLKLACSVESWWSAATVAAAFAFVMLTNYSLLHEAEHGILFPRRFWNDAAGRWHALLFPSSFTLMRTTHLGHHRRNCTDSEMFDLYYRTDRKWLKFVQWYGILLGLFWPTAPLGAIVMSLRPPRGMERYFTWARTTQRWIADFQDAEVRAIRWETIAGLTVWFLLWRGLDLDPGRVLLCYACFGFNWSTRQYVEHAYTQRDVFDGVHNLRCARWLSCVMLHHEWHRNHHRQPQVPWIYLPQLSTSREERLEYWRAYVRLWGGPRPTDEPPPRTVSVNSASFESAAP